MQTLTDPITVPSLVRWEVKRVRLDPDNDLPQGTVEIHILPATGRAKALKFELKVFDTPDTESGLGIGFTQTLVKNPDAESFSDMVRVVGKPIAGAFTAISNAYNSARSNSLQNDAVEAQCLALGIMFA